MWHFFRLSPIKCLLLACTAVFVSAAAVKGSQRKQNIKDVPIAVYAFDQECLSDAGLDGVLDVYLTARTLLNQ